MIENQGATSNVDRLVSSPSADEPKQACQQGHRVQPIFHLSFPFATGQSCVTTPNACVSLDHNVYTRAICLQVQPFSQHHISPRQSHPARALHKRHLIDQQGSQNCMTSGEYVHTLPTPLHSQRPPTPSKSVTNTFSFTSSSTPVPCLAMTRSIRPTLPTLLPMREDSLLCP